jgi:hypothetical protein
MSGLKFIPSTKVSEFALPSSAALLSGFSLAMTMPVTMPLERANSQKLSNMLSLFA